MSEPSPPTLFPDRAWLYDVVGDLPGAHVADQPVWGDVVVLWVGTRMFGLLAAHPDGRMLLTLKLPPGQNDVLRDHHAWITPGYHTNKRHWSSLELDHPQADRGMIEMLVEDSHACLLATLPRWRQDEIRTGVSRP